MVFITRLHNPSSVGRRDHLLELRTGWAGQRDPGPDCIPDLLEQLYQLLPDGRQAYHERPADQGGLMQSHADGCHRSFDQHAIVQVRPSEEFGRDQGKRHVRDQAERQASRDRTFRQPRFELFRSATAAEQPERYHRSHSLRDRGIALHHINGCLGPDYVCVLQGRQCSRRRGRPRGCQCH